MKLETGTRAHSGNRGHPRVGLQRQSLVRPRRAKPYRRQRATRTPILIHPRAGAPAPIPISSDVSVGHEWALSCGFHCHGGCLGRAADGRTPRASSALRDGLRPPLTREPLRALMAGERAGQRPARRIRAAQTESLERARIRPTETSVDPDSFRSYGIRASRLTDRAT